MELPPSPLLSPSPLSESRGQEMRVRGKELSFYIWGEPAALGQQVPAARQGGGRLPPGPSAQKKYIYLHVGPCRPLPGGKGIKL